MRVRSRVLLAAIAATALSCVGVISLLSSSASAQGTSVTHRVIVVFKNQDQAQPASKAQLTNRRSSFQATQAPVMSQLNATGAANVQSYSVLDALSATVSPSEEAALKSNSAVQEVIPDQLIPLASADTGGNAAAASSSAPLPGTCSSDPKDPELDPQALTTIGADSQTPGAKTARSLGITGAGVSVAYIADGIDTNNPDFIRPNGKKVFTDYKDFSGAGTDVPTAGGEAFLDASSIAAQGREVYNTSTYGPLSSKGPCYIRIEGVAPGASLVGLSVFGENDDAGFNSTILQAINYAVTTDHVNVLNESFGDNFYPDDQASLDLIKQANDDAVAAGTTVTVSSGDAGVTSTIGTPSSDPDVISAGASTTYRIDAQDGYGGARFPGVTGWLDDNISSLSSSGFEQDGQTINLVAPGELNWALCSTDVTMYADCTNYNGDPSPIQASGGTSESAPLTAGAAALVIQAYRQTHAGANPTPAVVKSILVSNTDDIGAPADQQGTGRLNAYKAVLAARNYDVIKPLASTPVGVSTANPVQLNAIDQPGTPESLTDTITNQSGRTENVSLSTRAIGPYTQIANATVNLNLFDSHTTDWQGINDNVETVHFTVPPGENRLSASIAYQNALSDLDAGYLNARVRLTLIDPNGKLASYDLPQGDGNYGNSQVTNPASGVWTAYIYSRDRKDGGTTGPVVFGASVAKYTTFGTVTPSSATLAPGQSVAANLRVSTPSTPGDSAGAIVVDATSGGQANATATTVPVTLRSLIPSGTSSFTGTTTGGNGRGVISGQTFYYQLNVPSGAPELNANVALANNPNQTFGAWLVDPAGEAVAYSTNVVAGATALVNESAAQLHTLAPTAGTWTLIVEYGPQAAGTELSQPFTVTTSQTAVPATAGALPNSSATTLTPGTAHVYNVTVKNTGTAPEYFFPDARLPGSTQLSLGSLAGSTTEEPLTATSSIPEYLIPTDSAALSETATTTGSAPVQFDTGAPSGDPDIVSSAGTTATLSFDADPLSQGPWDIAPVPVGPFGATGAATEPVSTSATVTTAPFDATVSSPTGDLEADSASPQTTLLASPSTFAPIEVAPGQTGTIPVTITPTGAAGSTVTGTLYLDDYSSILYTAFLDPIGDQVAALPYSYTIK